MGGKEAYAELPGSITWEEGETFRNRKGLVALLSTRCRPASESLVPWSFLLNIPPSEARKKAKHTQVGAGRNPETKGKTEEEILSRATELQKKRKQPYT